MIKLRIIPTSEGYYDAFTGQYVYNFTDHLGNVRLSYSDTNKDGTIQPRQYFQSQCENIPWDPWNPPSCIDIWKPGEIVEVNNYYPFGMLHNYTATTQNAYQYKYQGQELQETGWYSFKWRNYDPTIGRFFNVDPLSEKHAYQSHYNFSENWVINARELEGLEAVFVNKNTVEWRVKIDNQLGRDYSSTLLSKASENLSKNGLTVNIISDDKAVFTVQLFTPKYKITTEGMFRINGASPYDGNIYDGMVTSQDDPRTLAHELGHKAGQPHFWETVDNPTTPENEKIENTSENKDNLMNSDGNPNAANASVNGTNLTPSQTKGIINHIKIYNENRERNNKEINNTNEKNTP